MRKFNKKLLGFASVSLMLATLAGCGSGGDDGRIKVVFGHTFGDKIEAALNTRIALFKKLIKDNEGVDVDVELQYLGGYSDVSTKITTYFADGTLPTMTVAYPDAVADFIRNFGTRYVVNFDDYMDDPEIGFGTDRYLGDTNGKDDFIESYLREGQQFTVEGTYSLPFLKSSEVMIYNVDAATRMMNYYNPSVVSEGKVEQTIANFTWDEFMDFARVAYEHKGDISTLQTPVFYDSDSNMFITQMYQEDYQYSSIQNGKGHIDFDDGPDGPNYTGAVSLLEDYKDWHAKGYLTTKGVVGTYASNYFKEGKCIFSIGSSGGGGYTFPDAGQFTSAVCKVPYRNNKPYYISQGASIAFLRNPFLSNEQNDLKLKYAWKFLKYITSTKQNTYICLKGSEGYVPVRTSCYSTEEYLTFIAEDDNYARLAKVVTDDINGRFINTAVFSGSATLRTAVGSAVTGYLTDKVDSASGAVDAAINTAKGDME